MNIALGVSNGELVRNALARRWHPAASGHRVYHNFFVSVFEHYWGVVGG